MGALQSISNFFGATPTQQAPPLPSTITSIRTVPLTTPLSTAKHTVFISHAGADKETIAIPLSDMLMKRSITAFVDETDMPPGTPAADAMVSAMESAEIAVIVLSPEFIAREWPMKELMCFLRRREETSQDLVCRPLIIPFFYRLGISELREEPRIARVDSDGNSIYRKSRFLERMEAGEPEANIEKIKAALQNLHGIMGVRNDLGATNGSAYVMCQRREVLLRELCDKIRQHVRADAVTGARNNVDTISCREGDLFHAYFDPRPDTCDLVFEFGDTANTQEANILRMVVESGTVNRVIVIHGIAGVGKTSILREMTCLPKVKEHFQDGVHDISLGMDATKGKLIEELSKAVERSGGVERAKRMRRENDVANVVESFQKRFVNKKCLFTVDDVWQSDEMTSSIIRDLMRLHVSGDESKVILTTKSSDIASRANSHIRLETRDTLGLESRRVLRHYAKDGPEDDDGEAAEQEILERCGGLPLFLTVAGKAVKVLSLRPGHEGYAAYHTYARNLKANMRSMLSADVDRYHRLDAGLKISIDMLEERKAHLGFVVSRSMGEIHRRLSVLKKQSKVPMRMLKHLWELENETQAAIIAGEFEQGGLAEVEYERRGWDRVEVLRLHDSLCAFAMSESCKYEEERLGHELILKGYCQPLSVSDGHAEWWSLEDDGYILGNVCRHLFAARRGSELVRLVLSPQWTERQLRVNGILNLEADFALAIESMRSEMVDENEDVDSEMKEALRLISEAAVLSWSFVSENFRELRFQMHGRLRRYGERLRWVGEYVGRFGMNESRPSVLCANSFLGEPDGANVRIVSVKDPIYCMTIMKQRERVACGCGDGGIVIVNTVRKKSENGWQAHGEVVTSITVARNFTRIVSASRDRTVKVWDAESRCCLTTFGGHTKNVTDVEVMKDDERVVSVSEDGTGQVWDMDSGHVLSPPFTGHGAPVYCMAVLRDGEHVITGGRDRKLRMWSSRTGHQVGVSFEGHESVALSIAVSPDGRRIVSGSADHTVRVWDIQSHSQIGQPLIGHTHCVWSVAFCGDGSRIVSGSEDTTIRVWDRESGNEMCPPLIDHGSTVEEVSFLGHDDIVFSCSRDATVRLWDLRRQKAGRIRARHKNVVHSVVFTPNGRFLVSASRDRTLRIWDSTSGHQVGDPLNGHSASVLGVAVTPNGRFIVSASLDKTVCVWDLQTRTVLHRFNGHTDGINCLAVTPQGDRAVTGSKDKSVRVWDLRASDSSPVILEGHRADVDRVFVSDDGVRIVSVAASFSENHFEDEIFVWEAETQLVLNRLRKRHAWTMSRREIFDLVGEKTVQDHAKLSIPLYGKRIWHSEGRDKQVLATMESQVRSWALSPDQKTLCLGCIDGQVGLMKLQK